MLRSFSICLFFSIIDVYNFFLYLEMMSKTFFKEKNLLRRIIVGMGEE